MKGESVTLRWPTQGHKARNNKTVHWFLFSHREGVRLCSAVLETTMCVRMARATAKTQDLGPHPKFESLGLEARNLHFFKASLPSLFLYAVKLRTIIISIHGQPLAKFWDWGRFPLSYLPPALNLGLLFSISSSLPVFFDQNPSKKKICKSYKYHSFIKFLPFGKDQVLSR